MGDMPTGTTTTVMGTPSKDAEANRTYSNGSGHREDAKASMVTETNEMPEGSSAVAEEPKDTAPAPPLTLETTTRM